MAKRKKKELEGQFMKNWQKASLILLVIGTLAFIKIAFFSNFGQEPPTEETKTEETATPKEETNQDVPKSSVNVYFIGQNDNGEEVYKVVKREYQRTDGTKLKVSIEDLLAGPSKEETARGIYSEIPSGTKLISLVENPDKIVINLSSDFEQGGGTDGLYKRLFQLIKTANKNTTLDVYLYINGKQVDVIGGEGIMLNQPLSEKSLEE